MSKRTKIVLGVAAACVVAGHFWMMWQIQSRLDWIGYEARVVANSQIGRGEHAGAMMVYVVNDSNVRPR